MAAWPEEPSVGGECWGQQLLCAAPALLWPKKNGRKGSDRWEIPDALRAQRRRPQLGERLSF